MQAPTSECVYGSALLDNKEPLSERHNASVPSQADAHVPYDENLFHRVQVPDRLAGSSRPTASSVSLFFYEATATVEQSSDDVSRWALDFQTSLFQRGKLWASSPSSTAQFLHQAFSFPGVAWEALKAFICLCMACASYVINAVLAGFQVLGLLVYSDYSALIGALIIVIITCILTQISFSDLRYSTIGGDITYYVFKETRATRPSPETTTEYMERCTLLVLSDGTRILGPPSKSLFIATFSCMVASSAAGFAVVRKRRIEDETNNAFIFILTSGLYAIFEFIIIPSRLYMAFCTTALCIALCAFMTVTVPDNAKFAGRTALGTIGSFFVACSAWPFCYSDIFAKCGSPGSKFASDTATRLVICALLWDIWRSFEFWTLAHLRDDVSCKRFSRNRLVVMCMVTLANIVPGLLLDSEENISSAALLGVLSFIISFLNIYACAAKLEAMGKNDDLFASYYRDF